MYATASPQINSSAVTVMVSKGVCVFHAPQKVHIVNKAVSLFKENSIE
jgi:hypothetical protein